MLKLLIGNKFYCWMFTLFLYTVLVIDFFRLFFGSDSEWVSFIRLCVVTCTTIYILFYYIFKNKFSIVFLLWLVASLLFCFSYIINYRDNMSYTAAYANEYIFFIGKSFVGILFAFYLHDYRYFFEFQKRIILIPVMYAVTYLLLFRYEPVYNMSMSYSLLFSSVTSFLFYIDEKKIRYLFFSLLMLCAIFALGSRGPLVSYVFSIIIYLLLKYNRQKIQIVLHSIFFIFVYVVFYDYIINFLGSEFPESRTIRMLLNSFGDHTVFSLSGREDIYSILWEYIQSNILVFTGPFGDRIILDELLELGGRYNLYPHNIFLEIVIQYGLLIALLIIYFLINLLIKGYIAVSKVKNYDLFKFYSYFASVGFLQLLWSGSYITNENFWILVIFLMLINFGGKLITRMR